VATARDRALAPIDPAAVPAGERTVVVGAVQEAGVATYHLAVTIAAGLLALAGLLGAVFLRNPRRREAAAGCAGGQLAGAPRAAAAAR
jgi:hypothetical protein